MRSRVFDALCPAVTPLTHGFGPAEAVELARALGRLPRQTIVYTIEGASFETDASLSPAVAPTVTETVRRLRAEIGGTDVSFLDFD